MAEYYNAQGTSPLIITGEYRNTLDLENFTLMLKDPSYCYKFYWLEALVKLISENKTTLTFGDVIDEMISNAWYTVCEFHVHLSGIQVGEVRDGLERAVLLLKDISSLPANASKTEVKNAINAHETELRKYREQLTNMVPYRALAGFFGRTDKTPDWGSPVRMTDYIREVNESAVLLPYTLGSSSKLKKEVYINETWAEMIRSNTVEILGWIQFEKLKWLQNNNPEVPGLVHKLAPLDEKMRKLGNVHKLWDAILSTVPVRDVFTQKEILPENYDVDHFVPWSFVMNDELWNLMPMDSSLNSSKSNRLPKWNPFFESFASNQFLMYKQIHSRPEIHHLFEACYRDNLHSIWAAQELYLPGNNRQAFFNILEKNMRPVYDSARRQGYEQWNYGKTTEIYTLQSRAASPVESYRTGKKKD